MNVQCECGKFRAALGGFPKKSPGRLVCYCDDCQVYLHHLGRTDLLDSAGGTELVPVYPSEVKILEGREQLQCIRLTPKGLFRWFTSCCNTPIANTRPGFPWIGFLSRVYEVNEPGFLEKTMGSIRSRVAGRYAQGAPPEGTANNVTFKDVIVVFPFLIKGFVTGKGKNSPFFESDGVTPIAQPHTLAADERVSVRSKLGF